MKISVITVVYNSAHTIKDALESVAAQSHTDIEHIVIDGASTDGTAEVIESYQEQLAHFISEPDKGIYDAMNKGLRLVTGDVVGFLNADDVYANANVLSRVAELHQDPTLEGCYADLVYLDNLGDDKIQRHWRSKPYQSGLCFKGWMPAHPTFYLKKRVIEKVGEFKPELGNQADLEFCARAFELHGITSQYCSEIWVHMRTGGASQANVLTMIKSNWTSYKALRKLGLKRDPISYFIIKFGSKLPQFFAKSLNS